VPYTDLERRRVYWLHKAMKTRCAPNAKPGDYERYYKRGIRVCERWRGRGGFQNFLDDMGPRPTPQHEIDRIDNNGDYTPENCRWTTHDVQTANKRTRWDAISPALCEVACTGIDAGASMNDMARRLGIPIGSIGGIYHRHLRELERSR
jgi:hypothetical protein